MGLEELLISRLGPDRMSQFLDAADHNHNAAMRLYEWNARVSASMFELLADVEVVLRTALDRALAQWSERHDYGLWYENRHGLLHERALVDIQGARGRLTRRGWPDSPDRIVAELSFGFWRYLVAKGYRTTLWPAIGHRAFPNLDRGDADRFTARIVRLHDLRNRVAHHEPIHWRRLDLDLSDCLAVIGAVCHDTREWSRSRTDLPRLLAQRPAGRSSM